MVTHGISIANPKNVIFFIKEKVMNKENIRNAKNFDELSDIKYVYKNRKQWYLIVYYN